MLLFFRSVLGLIPHALGHTDLRNHLPNHVGWSHKIPCEHQSAFLFRPMEQVFPVAQ